jgi:Spy/CpxP family protein refolding chaperone
MKNGVESLGRIRAQGIAILLLTFVVGVLVGFAGERVRNARRARPPLEVGPDMMARFRQGNPPAMFRRLNLTPEQVRQIAVIMENGRPRSDAVLEEMLPRLRAVTDSIGQEIRGVLTAEQAAVWDSMAAHWRRGRMGERMPGRRGGRGNPPPPIP